MIPMGAATGRGSRSRRRRSDLIRLANLVEQIRISGGPAWIESDRFAIEAATGPGVSSGDARAMIRAMLARRHSSTASATTAATGRSGASAHSRNGVVQVRCGAGAKLALCSRHQLRAVRDADGANDSPTRGAPGGELVVHGPPTQADRYRFTAISAVSPLISIRVPNGRDSSARRSRM